MRQFLPKPKPDVRIEWSAYSKTPLVWGSGSYVFGYSPFDLKRHDPLGWVESESDLPLSGSTGDCYMVGGQPWLWDGSSWERVDPSIDGDLRTRDFGVGNSVFSVDRKTLVTFLSYTNFKDTGCFPVSWEWQFGDGGEAYGPSATHVYSTANMEGVQVVLTVTDNKGRKWRARKQMYINETAIRPMIVSQSRTVVIDRDPTYRSAILQEDPTMLLSLGSTDGLDDLSGNSNDGSGQGGATIGGYSPGPLAFNDDGATTLDGVDDAIATGLQPFGESQITFMGFARYPGSQMALFGGTTTSPAFYLGMGGNVSFRRNGTTTAGQALWTGVVDPGSWFHWALTIDYGLSEAKLYIDGDFISTESISAPSTTSGTLQIGRRGASGGGFSTYWNGQQAWFSVHEHILPPEKIAALSGFMV